VERNDHDGQEEGTGVKFSIIDTGLGIKVEE